MVKIDPFNVASHNVTDYKNVTMTLNEDVLYIIGCLIQFTAHSYQLGGK
jgi:hypothetical protein